MEGFYRRRVGQEVISKRKDCFQQSHIPLGGKAGGLIRWVTSSSYGGRRGGMSLFLWWDGEGPCDLIGAA